MIDILLLNYWEHVKAEKDLSRIFPPENKKRIELNKAANDLLVKIREIEND